MTATTNWVDRLEAYDDTTLSEQLNFCPDPLQSLSQKSPADAYLEVCEQLNSLFVVTPQILEIAKRILGAAFASVRRRLPNSDFHAQSLYSKNLYRDVICEFPECSPIMLAGVAGFGKTSLLQALARVLRYRTGSDALAYDGLIPLRAYMTHRIRTSGTSRNVLNDLYRELTDHTTGKRLSNIDEVIACELFRRGIALIGLDELQRVTATAGSTGWVKNILLSLIATRCPAICATNFGMCHDLVKSEKQHLDRLFGNVIVARSEARGSSAWLLQVAGQARALEGIVDIDPEAAANLIWDLTAAVPRCSSRLLALSYQRAREDGRTFATIDDVKRVGRSGAYRLNMEMVSELRQGFSSNPRCERDYFLPERLRDVAESLNSDNRRSEHLRGAAALQIAEDSLQSDERQKLSELQKCSGNSKAAPRSRTTSKSSSKKDDLRANLTALKKMINK